MRWKRAVSVTTIVVLVGAGSSCADPDPSVVVESGDTVESGNTLGPPDTVECNVADAVELDADWPFAVGPSVVISDFGRDDLKFSVTGQSDDLAAAISDALDVTFPEFESSEPSGDDTNVEISFDSILGTGTLKAADGDGDGCWSIDLAAEFVQLPDPSIPSGTVADPLAGLPSVGSADVVTARGTFQLIVTECALMPLEVEAIGPAGTLSITESGDQVQLIWTYDDGASVESQKALVFGRDSSRASIAADGETEAGPESVIAEVSC